MKPKTIRLVLLAALAAVVLVPLAGGLVRFGGTPPGYGEFPPRHGPPVPGFNPTFFWIGVAVETVIALFFLFPRWFGFQKVTRPPRAKSSGRFPAWFWIGGATFAVCLGIFWAKIPVLDALDPYMAVPLWWGFTLALDGWVYRRTGGLSLLATKPQTLLLLAVISSGGWFMFEYLDYFVLGNWYYPDTIFTPYGNIVWFLACYTGIFPQLFEYYHLFQTVPKLADRYSRGPKIRVPRWGWGLVLLVGLAGSFLMGLFPFEFFLTIWTNPVFILWAALGFAGLWTVFTPLETGNWSPLLLTGIAMVVSGLGWELVNFGSEFFFHYRPVNPSYWMYSVPYVNSVHLPFSQMPILGYMGYIPYAWICWLQWVLAARLFGFSPSLELKQEAP
jgi:hypothetical protein